VSVFGAEFGAQNLAKENVNRDETGRQVMANRKQKLGNKHNTGLPYIEA
jgi:hypothetical protein